MLAATLAIASACVTTDTSPEAGGPLRAESVVIPLGAGGTGERAPLDEYFGSVMELLHDAVLERDPARLRSLCDQHDRARAPAWARAQIARYRGIAAMLEVETYVRTESRVELRGAVAPALGETVPLAFRIPAGAPVGVQLAPPQSGRFHVQLEIVDHDCLGGRVERSFSEIVAPSRVTDLAREGLELPFDVAALPPEGVYRTLRCRVGLLPGDVELGGVRLPIGRVLCAERVFELFPRGVEPILAEPLKTLDNALRSGRTQHLDHVYLAARFMPGADRAAAGALLIQRVRVGDSVLARASMAALAVLTGEPISVDDRDGWLRWWYQSEAAGGSGR